MSLTRRSNLLFLMFVIKVAQHFTHKSLADQREINAPELMQVQVLAFRAQNFYVRYLVVRIMTCAKRAGFTLIFIEMKIRELTRFRF